MAPKDENELRQMLAAAYQMQGPVAIRYPRGAGLGVDICQDFLPLPTGKAEILQKKGNIALLAAGTMVEKAVEAAGILEAEGIEVTVVNARFIKPLDEELLKELAADMKLIVTMEENVLAGGFGSAVLEFLAQCPSMPKVERIGIEDCFVEQGSRSALLQEQGLSAAKAVALVQAFVGK